MNAALTNQSINNIAYVLVLFYTDLMRDFVDRVPMRIGLTDRDTEGTFIYTNRAHTEVGKNVTFYFQREKWMKKRRSRERMCGEEGKEARDEWKHKEAFSISYLYLAFVSNNT